MSSVLRHLVIAAAIVFGMAPSQTMSQTSSETPSSETSQEKKDISKPSNPRLAFDQTLANEKKFVVVGTVRTADGKEPLEGVEVTASAGEGTLRQTGMTKTDKDGRFRLIFHPGMMFEGGRAGGVSIVYARKPGWHGWAYGSPAQFILSDQPLAEKDVPAKTTNLVPGTPSQLEFRMQPAASLTLRLFDGNGKALENTRIWLTGDNLPPGASVIADQRTDAGGTFTVKDVPRNSYRLVVVDDPSSDRKPLELGSIHFRDAAEYVAVATIHEWSPESTHVSFKVTRGQNR